MTPFKKLDKKISKLKKKILKLETLKAELEKNEYMVFPDGRIGFFKNIELVLKFRTGINSNTGNEELIFVEYQIVDNENDCRIRPISKESIRKYEIPSIKSGVFPQHVLDKKSKFYKRFGKVTVDEKEHSYRFMNI